MTREEEILNMAGIHCENVDADMMEEDIYELVFNAFANGMAYADEHPKSPWISIKDKLPKKDDDILVFVTHNDKPMYAWWKGIYLLEDIKKGDCDFNAWMPIPKFKEE